MADIPMTAEHDRAFMHATVIGDLCPRACAVVGPQIRNHLGAAKISLGMLREFIAVFRDRITERGLQAITESIDAIEEDHRGIERITDALHPRGAHSHPTDGSGGGGSGGVGTMAEPLELLYHFAHPDAGPAGQTGGSNLPPMATLGAPCACCEAHPAYASGRLWVKASAPWPDGAVLCDACDALGHSPDTKRCALRGVP